MKYIVVFMMVALVYVPGMAQTQAKNDALKLDADYYLMDKDFTKALNNYLNILKSEPDNADIKYKIGICYLNSENDKAKAIPYLEEASLKVSEKHNPNSFKETNAPIDALFLLGSAYRMNNQLDEAMSAYTSYKNYLDPGDEYNLRVIDQYLRNCELAKTMRQDPVSISSVNLGKPVNTEMANFNAVVSGDGKTLFYTVPSRMGFDIYTTTFKDTAWSAPRNITSTIGSGKFMKTCDISYDGNTLLLYLDDPMNADIYMSTLNKGRWSKAEPLGKEINSKYNETHASLTTDGNTMYFTSDRKGGQGDMDIYKSEKDSKGEWGKAVNLGTIINTPFNEATPFPAETGDKLYFSSEGHDGMGGYDIFFYDYANPLKGVVNIGYPINTTDNDLFYMPVSDGSSAYYSFRGNDSYGGRDIYLVSVSERVEQQPVQEEAVYVETPVSEVPAETYHSDTVMVPASAEITETIPETITDIPAEVPVTDVLPDPMPVTENPMPVENSAQPETVAPESASLTETDPLPVEEETIPKPEPEMDTHVTYSESTNIASSYRVQIMALKKQMDLSHFAGITGVAVTYNDSWFRYTVGNTTDRQLAERLLSEVISKGYKDAFIRTYAVYPQFTIQVMAVPGPVVNLSQFAELNEISVTKGTDNFCRYTTGEFTSKEAALNSLERVKSLGYNSAFVAKIK